jgi:hypothetical protein
MKPLKSSIVAALAALALATDLAAPASAQTQTAYSTNPVTVSGFTAEPVLSPAGVPTLSGWRLAPSSSEVTISFVNTANVPAKRVEFAVRSGHKTAVIVYKGTFSPGTSIVHTFNERTDFDNASSVRVQAVTFADGSTWNGA